MLKLTGFKTFKFKFYLKSIAIILLSDYFLIFAQPGICLHFLAIEL